MMNSLTIERTNSYLQPSNDNDDNFCQAEMSSAETIRTGEFGSV